MQVDYVLLLAAGYGTRMGKIGEYFPKVLFPVFEKSLLELQLKYCTQFNPKKIFINVHHNPESILSALKKCDLSVEVFPLVEDTLLGSGGAIHNLASLSDVNYEGRLLTLNADQFIFLNPKDLERFMQFTSDVNCRLMTIEARKGDGYNFFNIENGLLDSIVADNDYRRLSGVTYSGMSLINLSRLEPFHEKSSFFDTVANYKNPEFKVECFEPGGDAEYWDFGTQTRYRDSMFNLLRILNLEKTSSFLKFCEDCGVFNPDQIQAELKSYGNTESIEVINLSRFCVEGGPRSIVLDALADTVIDENSLLYNNISEKIEH